MSGQPIKIYEPAIPKPRLVRFQETRGTFPPAARFQVKTPKGSQSVKLIFNCQAVDRHGLGTDSRSADLFWSEETREIVLELFTSPYRGQRRITHIKSHSCSVISITKFLTAFNIPLSYHRRYSVKGDVDRKYLYVDMADSTPVSRNQYKSRD
ncbi:MAG: hypothetical protein V3T83_02795 [Acidobacteriota bacterium]